MIKVLFQLNQLGYGGTEKAILTFIKNLDKNIFEPSLFFNTSINTFEHQKIKFFSKFSLKYKKKFNEKYALGWVRANEFSEAVSGRLCYGWGMRDLLRYQDAINPSIIHVSRGLPEDFYTREILKLSGKSKIVEYNIFGTRPSLQYLTAIDRMLFVSHWCLDRSDWAAREKSHVLYFPVGQPTSATPRSTLRQELGIPEDCIVLGRLSRPNLDDGDFILASLRELFDSFPNIHFVSIGESENFRKNTKGLLNVHCLTPTTDELRIDQFLTSLDILLHYRQEGETFGLNIAEAMLRGVPVVSHRSDVDNAQVELLTRERLSGVIAEARTVEAYTASVKKLITNQSLRKELGGNARVTAQNNFDTAQLTTSLESIYLSALER